MTQIKHALTLPQPLYAGVMSGVVDVIPLSESQARYLNGFDLAQRFLMVATRYGPPISPHMRIAYEQADNFGISNLHAQAVGTLRISRIERNTAGECQLNWAHGAFCALVVRKGIRLMRNPMEHPIGHINRPIRLDREITQDLLPITQMRMQLQKESMDNANPKTVYPDRPPEPDGGVWRGD